MCDSKECKDAACYDAEKTMQEFQLKFRKLIAHLQILVELNPETFNDVYGSFAEMCADITKTTEGMDKLREILKKFGQDPLEQPAEETDDSEA